MSLVSFVFHQVRLGKFVVVGIIGFVLQLSALAALVHVAHWPWLPATVVAVELAIVHNFLWHDQWTWHDRRVDRYAWLTRLARYNAATGVTSIAGNTLLMAIYVGVFGLSVLAGNALAVATMTIANFLVADRWVFVRPPATTGRAAASVAIAVVCSTTAAAQPRPETLDAWNRYVAGIEARLEHAPADAPPHATGDDIIAEGASIPVPEGTITHWRGAVFVGGVTVAALLDRLQHPGTPPPQEDILWSRVLSRRPDSLRVFIRVTRRSIVAVTYDTEHEVTFNRLTPSLATARSVATRLAEVGGDDHGFLWRLNSYWRYAETGGGVWVTLESLTLSRNVPSMIRPLAAPIVTRIARESMVRTLRSLRQYVAG